MPDWVLDVVVLGGLAIAGAFAYLI